MEEAQEVIDFVKALTDANRLKIVGLLAQKPRRMVEITEELRSTTREVYNHLAFLEFAGIVHKNDDLYQLDTDNLERLARREFEGKRPVYVAEDGMEETRRKALVTFLNADGSIRQMPNSKTQQAKFKMVLEYVLEAFEPGTTCSEKEVNLTLSRYSEDTAGLRRDLVDMGMLKRERDGSKYWRPAIQA